MHCRMGALPSNKLLYWYLWPIPSVTKSSQNRRHIFSQYPRKKRSNLATSGPFATDLLRIVNITPAPLLSGQVLIFKRIHIWAGAGVVPHLHRLGLGEAVFAHNSALEGLVALSPSHRAILSEAVSSSQIPCGKSKAEAVLAFFAQGSPGLDATRGKGEDSATCSMSNGKGSKWIPARCRAKRNCCAQLLGGEKHPVGCE